MNALPSGVHAWIIYVAAGLVVAILANVIWEYALRSLFSAVARLIWRVISHGRGRLANSIVQQAARRRTPTLKILLFVSCSALAMAFGISTGIALRLAWSPPGWSSVRAEYRAAESLPIAKREAALDHLVEHVEAYRTETEFRLARDLEYAAIPLSIALAIMFFNAIKVYFAYVMASRFEWVLEMKKATLSDAQIRELESKWACMQTTQDLDRIWNLLTPESR